MKTKTKDTLTILLSIVGFVIGFILAINGSAIVDTIYDKLNVIIPECISFWSCVNGAVLDCTRFALNILGVAILAISLGILVRIMGSKPC
jgi:hypothetical protein